MMICLVLSLVLTQVIFRLFELRYSFFLSLPLVFDFMFFSRRNPKKISLVDIFMLLTFSPSGLSKGCY